MGVYLGEMETKMMWKDRFSGYAFEIGVSMDDTQRWIVM